MKQQPQHGQPELAPEVERLVELCRTELGALEVYLFGSRARGDHREDSDYDLLAVLPDTAPLEAEHPMTLFRLRRQSRAHADLFAVRRQDFLGARSVVNTLSYCVACEGVRIYTAMRATEQD
ncbi:nucleotidyltransferase domain-containing protein [Roseivivax sediminis]|uniref:Predicted nucleotidyltransferase n=1 Tax=Roseivivax sediminis TaxID=936889 RepID=A0A1I2EIT1_9RHOB|nr:nucleotidyltransferase domain-containing protein [Roseivivax sediminis]SFE92537.1 Predicted nucleotidyltransferase [Roseivivax sediminis]